MSVSNLEEFQLDQFFPYLVRIYYRSVSNAVANAYASQFDLSVSEWRTMAVLGHFKALSASEIVTQSSMDKVTVSRAIKGLQARKFLNREVDGQDRRRVVLKLTSEGRKVFATIVPKAKELSEKCLDGLSNDERRQLILLMTKVRENAETLSNVRGGEE